MTHLWQRSPKAKGLPRSLSGLYTLSFGFWNNCTYVMSYLTDGAQILNKNLICASYTPYKHS